LLLHTPSRRTLPTDSTQPAPPNLRSTTWEWWCCCHLFPSSATSSAPGFSFVFYSLFFIIYSSFLLIATFFATWASVLHAIIIIRRRHWGRRSSAQVMIRVSKVGLFEEIFSDKHLQVLLLEERKCMRGPLSCVMRGS